MHQVSVNLNETLNRSLAWVSNNNENKSNMSLMNLSDCKEADYNYSYPKSKIKAKSVERECIPTDHH